MKIFFCIDEAAPLFKIGGLGDVGGSLPKALYSFGIDISLIIPKHPSIMLDQSFAVVRELTVSYDFKTLPVKIWKGLLPGSNVPTYVVEENTYISQNTDASDNHADKFAVFCLAFSTWVHSLAIADKPTIIHLNDWHTAMIPLIDKHILGEKSMKYVMTIHNLMYQSVTTTPIFEKMQMPKEACQIVAWDTQDNNINLLLEGLLHADSITTVSRRYAQEILTDEYGENINEILTLRKKYIAGIVNGLDVDSFNPSTDEALFAKFSSENAIEGKQRNKTALQAELGLAVDENTIVIGFVGRVDVRQKGIELIVEALKQKILIRDTQQFIFLGTGDSQAEIQLHDAANGQERIRIVTKYDEVLARKIYAASDYLIIPSKFEPCGLIQMIANRYGSIPVARETGGLADTIQHGINGFVFKEYDARVMVDALQSAISIGQDRMKKAQMVEIAMKKNFSWDESARQYQTLYESLQTSE